MQKSLSELSLDQLKRAIVIKQKIDALEADETSPHTAPVPADERRGRGRDHMGRFLHDSSPEPEQLLSQADPGQLDQCLVG